MSPKILNFAPEETGVVLELRMEIRRLQDKIQKLYEKQSVLLEKERIALAKKQEAEAALELYKPGERYLHALIAVGSMAEKAIEAAQFLSKKSAAARELWRALVGIHNTIEPLVEGKRWGECPIHDAKLQGENAKCYCKDIEAAEQARVEKVSKLRSLIKVAKQYWMDDQ